MDREQATEIHTSLLKAAEALDQAAKAISKLDETEQAYLVDPLVDMEAALYFRFLPALYTKHPELKPLGEAPVLISRTLRWEEVSLPESVSEADVDAVIFSTLTSEFQKTAMVIGEALQRCKELHMPISAESLGARIQALVELDRIECEGEPRRWRNSEIRSRE